MRKRKKNKQLQEIPKLESLKQINFNAGGIDIASAEIWVCVPEDRDPRPVRRFDTFTTDLHRAVSWLKSCGVDTVAMESTGIYWIPVHQILEANGIEVYLVNAHEVKNVPGRKSDILDCQWLQQLHTYGLLRRSFIPDKEIRKLRDLSDHRDNLIRHRATQIQYMQKALHLMNLQLDNVITDITGKTGLAIIRDIVRGQRDPKVLAQYRDPNCKNPIEVIEKSLEGTYCNEHLFQLKQSLELYDFFSEKIAECEKQIEQHYKRFRSKANPHELPPTRKKDSRTKNRMHFDLRAELFRLCGVDLTAIDSVNAVVAHTVIAHTGLDMSRWKTEKHFTSWLRLCPKNDTSAGRVLRKSTGKTQNKATLALKQAAKSLNRSKSYLGAYYRRMKAIHGPAKAATAAAHKIARIIYVMLKEQKEYLDLGENYFMQKNKERELKKLSKKANALGFYIVTPEHYQRLVAGVS